MKIEKTYEDQAYGCGRSLKKAIKDLHRRAVSGACAAADFKYDSVNITVTVDRIETSQTVDPFSGDSKMCVTVYGRYKAVTEQHV